MDADEELGQPIVSNGLPLTKIHHAALDADPIAVDPDFRIHVSDRLLQCPSFFALPDWFCTAPIAQPPTIGNRHHDQDLVRSRCIGH